MNTGEEETLREKTKVRRSLIRLRLRTKKKQETKGSELHSGSRAEAEP